MNLLSITALGSVATGNMNAQDAESVAGSIKSKRRMLSVTDKAEGMGRIIVAVAVFEVISVRAKVWTHPD